MKQVILLDKSVSTAGLKVGDPIRMTGKSTRHRFRVGSVLSPTSFSVVEYIRPSRGYARHVRREKAKRKMP